MRDITTKQVYQERMQAEISSNLGDKGHNVLVFIEEEMSQRISDGDADSQYIIPNTAWYDYLKNHQQFVLIRDFITKLYKDAGWEVNWYQDDSHTTHEWTIVLR